MFLWLFTLFNTRVLEFRVMAIKPNIHDFLHLLSVIKIMYNVNFGGEFGICISMPQDTFNFLKIGSRECRNMGLLHFNCHTIQKQFVLLSWIGKTLSL